MSQPIRAIVPLLGALAAALATGALFLVAPSIQRAPDGPAALRAVPSQETTARLAAPTPRVEERSSLPPRAPAPVATDDGPKSTGRLELHFDLSALSPAERRAATDGAMACITRFEEDEDPIQLCSSIDADGRAVFNTKGYCELTYAESTTPGAPRALRIGSRLFTATIRVDLDRGAHEVIRVPSVAVETLVGSVVDRAGFPVGGAEVVLVYHALERGDRRFCRWRTTSTDDGRFTIADAAVEGSALHVAADGFLDAYVPVSAGGSLVVPLEHDPARDLRVEVRLADGRPVADAWIQSAGRREATDANGTATIAHATGDELRSWAFLPPERLAVPGGSVAADPFPGSERDGQLEDAWSASGSPGREARTLRLTLRRAPEVRVALRAASGPVPGYVVLRWMEGDVSGRRLQSATSTLPPTSAGEFRFRRPSGAAVTLVAAARGRDWIPLSKALVVPASDHDVQVELELVPQVSLTGIVRDEAGAPLAGAEVRLHRTDGFPTHRRTATSDPQGLVHFEGLFEGQYAWRAAHDTHLFEGGGGVVRVPTGSDGWELVGALGGWIEVATYDVDRAHLDRAPVGLRGPDGYAHAPLSTTGLEFLHYGPNGPELTLSPGDRWLWGPLRAGAYTFTFDSGSGFDVHGVDVEAGRTAVVEVRARTAPQCVVRGTLGTGELLDPLGLHHIELLEGVHVRSRGRADASGRFELLSTTPGPHLLRILGVKGLEAPVTHAVDVQPGVQELAHIDVLSGAVRGNMAPVAGVNGAYGLTVELCRDEGGPALSECRPKVIDEVGVLGFGLDAVAPGTYMLRLVETRNGERTVHRQTSVVVEHDHVAQCWM